MFQVNPPPSESSARQRIHLKHQALFSSKDESKKLKCHLLQFLFGPLRVNNFINKNYAEIYVTPVLCLHINNLIKPSI